MLTGTLTGKHLIAGTWVQGAQTFASSPATGAALVVSVGTRADVDAACMAAEAAFWSYSALPRTDRAAFLDRIADEIEARGPQITAIGTAETGLPAARLEGERGRTTGQLRLFASHIRKPDFLDQRTDVALPDRAPLPRPEIRLMQRAVGPVAVFGASNFPLAFSTAGGDTASALAAGCPVVVKGHPAHPGTGEIIAEAVLAAITACGLHPGVFSLVQGDGREVGEALVKHPLITAVGFTGSLAGGRALFDLCARRPNPVPFYGELGSVNPMFLLPQAVAARGAAIGAGWAGSLTMGAGQFCTNPGIAVVMAGPEGEAFVAAAQAALAPMGAQTMLTEGIAAAYRAGRDRIAAAAERVVGSKDAGRSAAPGLFRVTGDAYLANPALSQEVFGPVGIVVMVRDADQMLELARGLEGQLTCTLHMDAGDTDLARALLPVLERKAGRILANGFPTGVEVSEAMVHGGPYPASTNFGATSVGTMAIRRWLRPVSYQNLPAALVPDGL
ncbi:MAG: aldehyde dehydrogenase (NADP(+)) [Pseudomonadota bacterium]